MPSPVPSHSHPDDAVELGAAIELASVPNLRDLGGYPVASGGRVRRGLLYRSVNLSRLTPDDAAVLTSFGIRTVFDLRTDVERAAEPDRLPADATAVVCDVLEGSPQAAPAELLEVLTDPARAAVMFADGKGVEFFRDAYRQFVSSPGALRAYRAFFTGVAGAGQSPVLFHCTMGKDRTGWAAAALLLLLGVDSDQVFADYELTNRDLLPTFAPMLTRFADAGGDPDILLPVLGVDRQYLQAALDEMTERFGSIRGYFRDGLGIDEDVQDQVRVALTA